MSVTREGSYDLLSLTDVYRSVCLHRRMPHGGSGSVKTAVDHLLAHESCSIRVLVDDLHVNIVRKRLDVCQIIFENHEIANLCYFLKSSKLVGNVHHPISII